MPLPSTSQSPPNNGSLMNSGQVKVRTPLGPVLITPGPSRKRPALGEKRVAAPVQEKEVDSNTMEVKARFPSAELGVESIGDVMAARLVTCLLGHVLFLKSQVPFPVAQLMKMTMGASDRQPNKKLHALLASFDLLSSHLGSTFTALSSSLFQGTTSAGSGSTSHNAKTHVAIILGPTATSANAARARIMLEIDGFHATFHGDPSPRPHTRAGVTPNENLKENAHAGVAWRDGTPGGPAQLRERRGLREISQRAELGADSDSDGEDERDSSFTETPPDSGTESESSEAESEEDDYSSTYEYEETEADIAAAERTLSRTLAVANSDPQLGMAADIRPTQIHILLRAPRRFAHPEWVPRHNLARDMDPLLQEFEAPPASTNASGEGDKALDDITNSPVQSSDRLSSVPKHNARTETKRGRPGGVKTDYVRVQSHGASDTSPFGTGSDKTGDNDRSENGDDDEDDGDEMIWWTWAGKLEGFTEI